MGVDDHARAICRAPGNEVDSRGALDRRERRLQGVYMPQVFRGLQLRKVVVRQSHRADFPGLLQIQQFLPVRLQRRAVSRRPVHLIEVDALDA